MIHRHPNDFAYSELHRPVPRQEIKPMDTPSCAAVQHERRWWVWAICGVVIGLLVVLHFAGGL